MERFSEQDAIQFNKLTEGGGVVTNGNLNFAVDFANREKNIFKASAIVVRGLTTYHSFSDGNKRTTAFLLFEIMEKEKYYCDKDMLMSGLLSIAEKRILSLPIIERRLRRWFIKK